MRVPSRLRKTLAGFALAIGIMLPACWAPVGWAQEQIADQQLASKIEFFETKIRPVLVEHCYECHSSDSKTIHGGLLLDSAQGLTKGGDSGPAIASEQPDQSLILQALRYESTQMPPKGKLPESIIADFSKWVSEGAIDPRTQSNLPVKKQIDIEQSRNFWAFVPPINSPIPETSYKDWPVSTIDHFVLAAMEARNLKPVAQADKRKLIRRATFDLTGLPPTPEEVDAFLNDTSASAFSKVIDRLLDSVAYGQRWGRFWLDVARYSEDQAHTFSVQPNTSGYRYRDWVIDALNADMPFDRFIKYQIAADVMEIDESERLSNLAALGYFGLGAQYYKNTDAAKAAADELDDRIDTLTRGFLGLTVSCARCHDHKFDPIPQQDYYSLAGVFHSSRLHNAPLVPATAVQQYNQSQQRIKKLEEGINQAIASHGPKLRESRVDQVAQYMIATKEFQAAKANDKSLRLANFAKQKQLDEAILKRWVEFLKSKSQSAPLSLRNWFARSDSDSSAEDQNAALEFQRHLQLLLQKRDGTISPDEQAELTRLSGTDSDKGARYISPSVTKNNPLTPIDVDLSGARELYLVVTDAGNGPSCDHADWIEPVLITNDGQVSLTDLKWKSVTASYGEVHLNKGVTGQPLRVAGKNYSKGLGTHSTSVIHYELPNGALRFVAQGGLDNSGSDQGGDCGANAAVEFRVYTQTPSDIQVAKSDLLAEVFGEKGVFSMDIKTMEKLLPTEVSETLTQQRSELEDLRRSAPAMYPIAHGIAESKPEDIKVMVRGNPANQGDLAPRRFLRILSPELPVAFTKGSGRLELADAIASAKNPLTSRVIVNRIWQHHFGKGLVGTPDNFGKLGDPPSHPELLDYLTLRFLENGWSVKSMHREIMLSATYQLSTDSDSHNSQIDADNRYLWRMNRQRLDVESWRDALLAVSGRLDETLHGPSTNLADANNSRRTIYGFISRHELDNMLRLFDFPDANITASTRAETTVPQQQLFVLNSPFMIEQSKAFADRIQKEAGPDSSDQVRRAYLVAYGRPADENELQIGVRYLQAQDSDDDKLFNKLSRIQRYAQALLASNEFMYLD